MTDTRTQLMNILLEHKEAGRTVDELSSRLGITRNAVQQHLLSLDRDGLVRVVQVRQTGGRPSRAYVLSEKGYETFPRHYAMLAHSLLQSVYETLGEAQVEKLLSRSADALVKELEPRLAQVPASARAGVVVEIMNELGYQASVLETGDGISAINCIYHQLAKETRAVCRYDVRLLANLLGTNVDHTHCMVEGDNACVFRFAASQGHAE